MYIKIENKEGICVFYKTHNLEEICDYNELLAIDVYCWVKIASIGETYETEYFIAEIIEEEF